MSRRRLFSIVFYQQGCWQKSPLQHAAEASFGTSWRSFTFIGIADFLLDFNLVNGLCTQIVKG